MAVAYLGLGDLGGVRLGFTLCHSQQGFSGPFDKPPSTLSNAQALRNHERKSGLRSPAQWSQEDSI
jgi:hypothetical protein